MASLDRVPALSELPQFFRRIAQYHQEFIIYDDGFRGWTFSYSEIARLATSFAARLRMEGVRKGDAVVIWSESRPGWIVELWGCLLEGAVVVPVDSQSSLDFFHKMERKVGARLILVGDRVPEISLGHVRVWRVAEIEQNSKLVEPTPAMSANWMPPVISLSAVERKR